jgi:hypothetical protein
MVKLWDAGEVRVIKEWAKLGLLIGIFWGIIFLLFGAAIGGLVGGLSGLIVGGTIGGAIGLVALIYIAIISGIKFALGRFIVEMFGWFSTSPYWRIFQVALIGGITWSILSAAFAGESISLAVNLIAAVIGSLINAWIVMFMYKKLKWRLPQ